MIKKLEKKNKLINLLILLIGLNTFALISSCSSITSDDNDSSDIAVSFTLGVTGTLGGNPTIEYRDANNILQSDPLTVGNWNKSFTVKSGYKIYLKISNGTIENGKVELSVRATGGDNSFSQTYDNTSSASPQTLNIFVEETLN